MPSEGHPFDRAGALGAERARPGGVRTRIKVCGLTRPEDVALLAELGVDAVGFIYAERSKRALTPTAAAALARVTPAILTRVGVFVDASLAELEAAQESAGLHLLQLHGALPEGLLEWAAARHVGLMRAVAFDADAPPRLPPAPPFDALLIDGPEAGSGQPFDWAGAAALRGAPGWVLAGGLTPQNAAAALTALRPPAVDVASGVEASPGVKSATALRAFVRAVRAFDAGDGGGRLASKGGGPAAD